MIQALRSIAVAIGLTATAGTMSGTVHYVAIGGTGAGTSWADATGDLQAAIDRAQAGDEVWVAAGRYRPDSLIRANKPTSRTFFIKDGVSLYGGFAGTEGDKAERQLLRCGKAWAMANPTILDANDDIADVWERAIADGTTYRYAWKYGNDSLEVVGTHGNGTHVLYRAETIVNPTEINGFTLTGGNANIWQTKAYGGAVYALGNVQLRACRFVENSAYFYAESTSDSNAYGGAVFLYSDGQGVIEDCYFARNYAHSSYGSGLGGAVYARRCAISRCEFVDCVADDGGALYNNGGTVTDCTFADCYAAAGGALFNYGTATGIDVTACRGLLGGGIYNHGGRMTNVLVTNCYADAPEFGSTMGGRGGGIHLVGGELVNVATCNNTAFLGGGIYVAGDGRIVNATAQHNTIRHNAEADTANIGMVDHSREAAIVLNSIYHDADPANFASPTTWRGVAQTAADTAALLAASWQLMPDSRFVDTGMVAPGFEVDTDLAGNARVVGAAIDMGAYEWQGGDEPSLKGDVNGDGTVDVADINIIINIMLGKADPDDYQGRAQVTDGDTDIDVADINAIINAMLGK